MREREFQCELWLPLPPAEVFPFFAEAGNVVRYAVPLDFIMHPLFVRPDIEKSFAFRREAVRKKFGCQQ